MEINTQGYELGQDVVVITTGATRNSTRIKGFAVFSRSDTVFAQVEIHDRWEGGTRDIWVAVDNLET